ncbi:MAG: HAMP domain-containing protein [Candidatus Eisenbacteria bacterium]|nr:HAMP domain-containing protein [Candidatus Eisenbacteria bacterium]
MRRIRNRLITLFVVVSLLPAIPASFLVWHLLARSLGPGTGDVVSGALAAGLDESRARLRAAKADFRGETERIWLPRIARNKLDIETINALPGGENLLILPLSEGRDAAAGPSPEDAELIAWAAGRGPVPGERTTAPERIGGRLALVAALPDGERVLFARPLEPEMIERAERIVEAMSLIEGLRLSRSAVVRSYAVPFLLSYLFLLLIAVAIGAVLARRLARPIEDLVASTGRVAAGDLETRVPIRGGGETRVLQEAFNRMVERLAEQRVTVARLERKAAWRDLARTLAHEIKNPLTPIQLAVQEIRDRYPGDGDDEYRRFLEEATEIVDEEVQALRRLVREFHDFARLPEPKPRRGDLIALLEELSRLYGPERVGLDAPRGSVAARFDPEELRRALINLIDNGLAACRAAGRPERVRLRAESADGIRIAVIDGGCGIPDADRERVFEPDFTTKSGGMGLGLPIVEGIITAHGGTIGIRSEPGRGTTFTIQLPEAPYGAPEPEDGHDR